MRIIEQEHPVFQTKSDYAYSVIKKDILEGKVSAGERLVIAKLAKRFNISDIPVRDALSRLASEGLVDVGTNNRSVVSTISPAELKDTIELRIILEPICSEMAVPHITGSTIAQLLLLIEKMDDAITVKDYDSIGVLNRSFHMLIYAHCPNKKIVGLIEDLYKSSNRARMIYHIHRERSDESNKEHRQMVDAIINKDAKRVFELVKRQKISALQSHIKAIDALT
jgi:DNA-binding GntR family transcriptional regulator